MSSSASPQPANVPTAPAPLIQAADQRVILLRIAWFSIVLGLLIEIIILLLRLTTGSLPGAATVVNDALQAISWPFLVCIGIAFGTALIAQQPAATEGSAAAKVHAFALSGLLAAPLAFLLVRLLHKAVGSAIGAAGSEFGVAAILILGVIKAAEYGLLGAAMDRLKEQPAPTARQFAQTGLLIGLVFGGAALLVHWLAANPEPSNTKMMTSGVNEIIVPVGCSMILYASGIVSKRVLG